MTTPPWTLEHVASLLEEWVRAAQGHEQRPMADLIADTHEALTWLHMVTTRFDAVLREWRNNR